MRTTILALALAGLAAHAQEKKPALAKVRVAGYLNGVEDFTTPDKKSYTGAFVGKGLEIEVRSPTPLAGVFADSQVAKVNIVNDRLQATIKLLKDPNLNAAAKK